ncbi:MAG: metal-sensing transcriptional repressor [Mangrovicoccus sp.]|nr:metal-sensing transcriptional repressor [Mangrovicoccus sp.]
MEHASHPDIAKRLKRAQGHLNKVIDMIETGRPCVELAQQLQAVESAISKAKKTLIHDHVEHCLSEAADGPEGRAAHLKEFREITRYL